MKQALFLVLAVTSVPSFASNWVAVENASVSGKLLVDVSSLQVDGDKRTVWTRMDLPTPRPSGGDPQKVWQRMLSRQQFDCGKVTVQALQIIMYSPAGEVVGQRGEPQPPQAVAPDTTSDELFEFVCSPRVKGGR